MGDVSLIVTFVERVNEGFTAFYVILFGHEFGCFLKIAITMYISLLMWAALVTRAS